MATLRIVASCGVALVVALAGNVAVAEPNDATPATRAAQKQAAAALPLGDRADFEDAQRGLIAPLPNGMVAGNPGAAPVWDLQRYEFLKAGQPADTVNPSLWRQAQLNLASGLFKVADRVYQLRGFDIANITIVEGDSGLIVTDATLTTQSAKAALDLYYQHRPKKPVLALIYTHSHADHFGGAGGLISAEDAAGGKVKVIAPEGFMEHAVAENVIAGNAMSRRAQFQFGTPLPVGARGQVDAGLGKALASGAISLIAPNDLIRQPYETRVIDGVEIEFHLVPESEAPAEMISFYPQFKVLNMAEDTTHTLHNLYTLRGAAIRDGRLWSKYIGEALDRYGARTEVVIAQHHWPVWGRERVASYLKKQRDVYKFIHDQSVRLLNHGLTPTEIAERLTLPPSLASEFAARGYYGSVSHNAKAVYQFYLGWYDANPADLNPLPRAEQAKKEIDYMGGAAAVLQRARDDYQAGQYRWVASVASKLVFADPSNKEARALGADALEQLGYQAEAATWRNAYLLGAQELRNGLARTAMNTANADLLKGVSIDLAFDFLAVRLDAAKAEGKRIVVNWTFTDVKETYTMTLENSALSHVAGRLSDDADVGVTLTRATFDAISTKQRGFLGAVLTGDLGVSGNPFKLRELFALFDEFSPNFEVVEPVKAKLE